jgi:hypothetical protein
MSRLATGVYRDPMRDSDDDEVGNLQILPAVPAVPVASDNEHPLPQQPSKIRAPIGSDSDSDAEQAAVAELEFAVGDLVRMMRRVTPVVPGAKRRNDVPACLSKGDLMIVQGWADVPGWLRGCRLDSALSSPDGVAPTLFFPARVGRSRFVAKLSPRQADPLRVQLVNASRRRILAESHRLTGNSASTTTAAIDLEVQASLQRASAAGAAAQETQLLSALRGQAVARGMALASAQSQSRAQLQNYLLGRMSVEREEERAREAAFAEEVAVVAREERDAAADSAS